jgi:hypothetical protein
MLFYRFEESKIFIISGNIAFNRARFYCAIEWASSLPPVAKLIFDQPIVETHFNPDQTVQFLNSLRLSICRDFKIITW